MSDAGETRLAKEVGLPLFMFQESLWGFLIFGLDGLVGVISSVQLVVSISTSARHVSQDRA